eukprot:TRINITY_DN15927_c0_g2_i1.p1 TRINITY_DN15927_c0_g2~~TRINITY_DN15927_c0_g2_i1.p1  ORF type:complete len:880 (-),score=121.30 TRINITY_DN15927_c0_g2_i1:227-2866(-)
MVGFRLKAPPMNLSLPKTISIVNPRLVIMYYLMILSGLAFSITVSTLSYSWKQWIPVLSRSQISVDVAETSASLAEYALLSRETRLSMCHSMRAKIPGLVVKSGVPLSDTICANYCGWRTGPQVSFAAFGNYSCMTAMDIISMDDDILKLRYAFFETRIYPSASTSTQNISTLAPWIVNMQLSINLSYVVDAAVPWFFGRQAPLQDFDSRPAAVLVNSEGLVWKTFGREERITVTLREILDDIVGREAGFIQVETQCYNDDYDVLQRLRVMSGGQNSQDSLEKRQISASSENPVCVLRFQNLRGAAPMRTEGWQLRQVVSSGQSTGSFGVDEYYKLEDFLGVSLRSVPAHGRMRVFDFSVLITVITSAIVLQTLPKQAITFLASWGLGALSKVYRRILQEPFSMVSQSVSSLLRIMSQEMLFNLVNRTKQGISRADLIHSLQEALVFQADLLDQQEIEHVADFVMESLAGANASKTATETVTLAQWCAAITECEPITMDLIAMIFDHDQPRQCLETFFTPPSLTQARVRLKTRTLSLASMDSSGSSPPDATVAITWEPAQEPAQEHAHQLPEVQRETFAPWGMLTVLRDELAELKDTQDKSNIRICALEMESMKIATQLNAALETIAAGRSRTLEDAQEIDGTAASRLRAPEASPLLHNGNSPSKFLGKFLDELEKSLESKGLAAMRPGTLETKQGMADSVSKLLEDLDGRLKSMETRVPATVDVATETSSSLFAKFNAAILDKQLVEKSLEHLELRVKILEASQSVQLDSDKDGDFGILPPLRRTRSAMLKSVSPHSNTARQSSPGHRSKPSSPGGRYQQSAPDHRSLQSSPGYRSLQSSPGHRSLPDRASGQISPEGPRRQPVWNSRILQTAEWPEL